MATVIGVWFATPPSTYSRRPIVTGGKTPGIAQLARSAGTAGPDVRIVARPLFSSVATTWSGTFASSRRLNGRCRSSRFRRFSFEMKWFARPMRPLALVIGLSGNTSCRRRPFQISPSSRTPSGSGHPAIQAALTAPTEVPTTKSGQTPCSNSALSIPTWTAPRLPPPESTKAQGPFPVAPWAAGEALIASLGWAPSQAASLMSRSLRRFSRWASSVTAASRRSHNRQSASDRHTWSSIDSSWVCMSGASDLDLNLTTLLLPRKRAPSHVATTTIGRFLDSTDAWPLWLSVDPDRRRTGVEGQVGGDLADRRRAGRAHCPQLEMASWAVGREEGDGLAVRGKRGGSDHAPADKRRGRAQGGSGGGEARDVQVRGLARALGAHHGDQLLVRRDGRLPAARVRARERCALAPGSPLDPDLGMHLKGVVDRELGVDQAAVAHRHRLDIAAGVVVRIREFLCSRPWGHRAHEDREVDAVAAEGVLGVEVVEQGLAVRAEARIEGPV